jgi:hypothetical protein
LKQHERNKRMAKGRYDNKGPISAFAKADKDTREVVTKSDRKKAGGKADALHRGVRTKLLAKEGRNNMGGKMKADKRAENLPKLKPN